MVEIAPNQAWLTIFLPVLFYYTVLSPATTPILSYLNLLPPYTPVVTTVRLHEGTPDEVYKILYENDRYSFEYVINSEEKEGCSDNINANASSFFDMTWVEDTELGRGFLLLSDAASSGKVWRYETGGGLIPIGTSLYLDQSGCRSKRFGNDVDGDRCNSGVNGSRGMAVQVMKDEGRFDIGSLLIVEHGERRIVRMEEDGARTPIVLNVPSLCDNDSSQKRLTTSVDGGKLIYTPFGDLLFTGTMDCQAGHIEERNKVESRSALYRLKEVVNIPPIPFRKSREAHLWEMKDLTQYHQEENKKSFDSFSVEVAYAGMSHISDVAVGKDMTSIFIAGRLDDKYIIYKTFDDSDGGSTNSIRNLRDFSAFYDMTDFFASCQEFNVGSMEESGIALTLDASGNIFATFPGGIAIIDTEGDLLATVSLDETLKILPTSIVIGNDGYLYLSSRTALFRWKIKSKLLDYPTNLIVPQKK